MKNMKCLSLVLAALMLVQSVLLPVKAAETTEAAETTQPAETFEPVAPPTIPLSEMEFGTVSIYNGCRGIDSMVQLSADGRILETAYSVVIYEQSTDTLVYAYNPDQRVSPGTLAKLVTALVVVENAPLDGIVTCSSRNISRLPRGQHVDLKEGERLTVEDLLYCLILQGANDAAVALSEFVSGNQESFVSLMNDRVRKMGCTNTLFGNVHGLDNKPQHTTARDMARIVMEVSKNPTLQKLLSTKGYEVAETNRSKKRVLRTTNYLIDELNINKYMDSRVTGGLASYSEASRANIVCTAKDDKGLDYVLVVMGSERRLKENGWQIEYYGNFDEMTNLIQYAFDNYRVKRILYDGQALKQFSVIGGENQVVGQPHVNVDTVLPNNVSMDNLIITERAVDGGLTAPIEKGQLISTVEVWYRTSCLTEAELYAMNSVRVDKESGVSIRGDTIRDDGDTSGFLGFVRIVSAIILIPVGGYLLINALLRARAKHRRKAGPRKPRRPDTRRPDPRRRRR